MQPPAKRRRLETSSVEAISFDNAARQEYLAGFHKRKLQRAKHAQEAAEKRARLERIEERRKLREERKAILERHIQEVNAFIKPLQDRESTRESQSESDPSEEASWDGISEPPRLDHKAEYVDEDRYTTVTIEAMNVSKEGLHKVDEDRRNEDTVKEGSQGRSNRAMEEVKNLGEKRKWTREKPQDKPDRPKKKKKKFRYESHGERKIARVKEKMRNSKRASARRAA